MKPTLKPVERERLRIHPKFRRAMMTLEPEVYAKLKADIERDGQLQLIIVWRDPQRPHILWIVDGHNRYNICKELGIKPKYRPRPLDPKRYPDEESVLQWIYDTQRHRRNLGKFALAEIYLKSAEYRRDEAEANARQRAGKLFVPDANLGISRNRMVEVIAAKCGTSPETARKIQFVVDSGREVIIKQARLQVISIERAYDLVLDRDATVPPIGKLYHDEALFGRLEKARQKFMTMASQVNKDIAAALIGTVPYPRSPDALDVLRKSIVDWLDHLGNERVRFAVKAERDKADKDKP